MSLYSDHVNSLTPLAYWRLGEVSGSTIAVDETGTYDGTYNGTPTLESTGLLVGDIDTAVALDGVDDNITTTSTIDFNYNDSFSLSAIIKFDVDGTFGIVGNGGRDATIWSGYKLEIYLGNKLRLWFASDYSGIGVINVFSTTALVANTQYHVTITYDGSGSAYGVSMYINGIAEVVIVDLDTLGTQQIVASNNVSIGYRAVLGADDLFFDGIIDEVIILNDEITESQAFKLYMSSLNIAIPTNYSEMVNYFNPLAYWRLGDAIGSTIAVDETGNYNATYVNTPTLETTGLLVDDLDTSTLFDGADQYGYVLNHVFNISTYSVSVIIQVSAYPNSNRTITKVSESINSTTQDKNLYIDSTGKITFHTFDGASHHNTSPNSIPLNEPVHIVATVGVTSNSLYINGKLVSTLSSSGSHSTFATANQFFGGHGASTFYFPGIVDEVCVFNTELTLDNAKDLYVYSLALSVPTNYEEKVKSLVPISYHRFAESSGLVAIDDIGNHNSTYSVAPTFQQTGALLDGSLDPCILVDTESISLSDHSDYNTSNSFTVSLFIKTIGAITDTYDMLWMKGASGSWGAGCGLIRTTDGGVNVVRFWIGHWQVQTVQFLDSLITDSEWHNIVVSYNGTTNLVSLYLDSVLQDTSTTSNSNYASILYMIKDPAIATTQYHGYYDELIYFNEDLTQTEITDLYNYATTVYVPPIVGLPKKAFDITIDHTKVDEDLYDFPLLVNLGSASGTNAFDSTPVFDELDVQNVNDDFTGTDSDPANPELWTTSSNDISIFSNTLRSYTVNQATQIDRRISSIHFTSLNDGDITSTVDYDFSNSTGLTNTTICIRLGVHQYDVNYNYLGERILDVYIDRYSASFLANGEVPTTIGKIKMKVTSGGVILFYDNGNGYEWNGDVNGGNAGIEVGATYFKFYLLTYHASGTSTLDSRFDNFTLIGDVIWLNNLLPESSLQRLTPMYMNPVDTLPIYPTNVNDDFTGTDGDQPNSELWKVNPLVDGSTVELAQNTLEVTIPSTANDTWCRIYTTYRLSGDFDFDFDYEIINADAPSSTVSYPIQIQILGSSQSSNIFMDIGSSNIKSIGSSGSITPWTHNTTNLLISKFRLTRIGSVIKGYYWDNGQWEWFGSTSGFLFSETDTSDVTIGISSSADFDAGTIIRIDNFKVNSGILVWDYPQDDTILTKKCYAEINRWDQLNEQAQIWVKVPYISKDVDTVINFSYDPLNIDNSDYIGYTGSIPAQTVWDGYDAVYHLSKDGNDSTVNGYDGTLVNMDSTNIVDADIGKALSFNNVDTSVNLNVINSLLSNNDDVTLSITFKTTSIPDTDHGNVIFATNTADGAGNVMFISTSLTGAIYINVGATSTYGSGFNDGIEHTLVITFNGAGNGNIYMDGVLLSTHTLPSILWSDTALTTLGAEYDGGLAINDWFDGIEQNVLISKDIKTATYTSTNYESTQDNLTSYVLADTYIILGEPIGELIGYSGSFNEWTKNQAINFILNNPKVMFSVRSRYKV